MRCPNCKKLVEAVQASPPNNMSMRCPGQAYKAFAVECQRCGLRGPINFNESPAFGHERAEKDWAETWERRAPRAPRSKP
jgi:hypothetical protein